MPFDGGETPPFEKSDGFLSYCFMIWKKSRKNVDLGKNDSFY